MEVTLYGLCGCLLRACQIRKAATHTVYAAAEITDVLPHIHHFTDTNCRAPEGPASCSIELQPAPTHPSGRFL